jgi:hypothetical protein
MRKFFEVGGIVAAIVLIAFGAAAVVLGVNGKNTIGNELKMQQIVGTPDMTPAGITAEAKSAHLNLATTPIPTCTVANLSVNNGDRARCFAQYMRIHTLEATGGVPYALMPRYATADGKGTNDPTMALLQNGQPVDNAARNIWITETALTTALNSSFMADQMANFGIVVGIALLLAGFGFAILTIGGALENKTLLRFAKRSNVMAPAVPVA